jgi:hypothetical protein
MMTNRVIVEFFNDYIRGRYGVQELVRNVAQATGTLIDGRAPERVRSNIRNILRRRGLSQNGQTITIQTLEQPHRLLKYYT